MNVDYCMFTKGNVFLKHSNQVVTMMWRLKIKQPCIFAMAVVLIINSTLARAVNVSESDSVNTIQNDSCAATKQSFSTFNEYIYSSFNRIENSQIKLTDSNSGLKILSLRRTAANMMLDLRFKILDIEQAKHILDRKTPVYLIDQVSGSRYRVPATTKLGPLRQTTKQIDTSKTYFIMFANPGRNIKQCDVVTVMIGDTSIDNIRVE